MSRSPPVGRHADGGQMKTILPPCSQIGTAKTGLDSHGISPQRRAGEILAVD